MMSFLAESSESGTVVSEGSKDLAYYLAPISRSRSILTADIVFLGDSVNSQLAQYFMCDLLGLGVSGSGDVAAASFNHTTAIFTLPAPPSPTPNEPSPRHSTLRVHNKQFNLPCIHSSATCREVTAALGVRPDPSVGLTAQTAQILEQITFDYVTQLLINYSSPKVLSAASSPSPGSITDASETGRVYIVFNYGLHVHQRSAHWAFRGMARALVAFAAARRQLETGGGASQRVVKLLVRETSSQAFWFSAGTVELSGAYNLYFGGLSDKVLTQMGVSCGVRTILALRATAVPPPP